MLILPYLKGNAGHYKGGAEEKQNRIDCRVKMGGTDWHVRWKLDEDTIEVKKQG